MDRDPGPGGRDAWRPGAGTPGGRDTEAGGRDAWRPGNGGRGPGRLEGGTRRTDGPVNVAMMKRFICRFEW